MVRPRNKCVACADEMLERRERAQHMNAEHSMHGRHGVARCMQGEGNRLSMPISGSAERAKRQ